MRNPRWIVAAFALTLALCAGSARSATRYHQMLTTEAGRDTLKNLALWEDQRVTGDGKLFDYLRSANPLVRLRAVQVIGRIQDPADTDRLLPLLKDADPRVAGEVYFALGQIGSDRAVPALTEVCKGNKRDDIAMAAEALGKIGGDTAVETLMGLLHDFHADVRAAAAMALARAADENAIPALLISAEDPDPDVSWRAIYALEKVESKKVADRIRKFLEKDQPLMVRRYAARTLGKQKDARSVKALAAMLEDGDLEIVVNAARALGEIGKDDAVDALGKVLTTHASHHARRAAATALGDIGKKRANDYLIRGLSDSSTGVRIACIDALAKVLGDNADMFIGQMLDDGNRLVRAAAITCVGTAEDKDRAQQMMQIATRDGDPVMRAAAVGALGHLDMDEVKPFLATKLDDEDWVVATTAAQGIGEREYKQAIPKLIATYRARQKREDVDVHLQILETLQKFDLNALGTDGVALLRDATGDPDKRVRTEAAESLRKLELEVPPMKSDREFYEAAFDRARREQLSPPMGSVQAVISTAHGDIEVELFSDDATQTVANFIALARKGFYNGLTFHRVVPNFVIQGGDPRGDGWGDAGYFIRSEFNRYHFDTGYLGIAHSGKDTGGCQFFITHSPQPHLDGRYTIFGVVRKGMDAVMAVDMGDEFSARIIE